MSWDAGWTQAARNRGVDKRQADERAAIGIRLMSARLGLVV
jgi:hypothetical protein